MATSYSGHILQHVFSKVICRKTEIDTLLTLFGEKSSFPCPAIFICGHTATGKSFVVQTLLNDLELPHVLVNCIESFTPRLIYEHILHQLQETELVDDLASLPKCDNMTDFFRQLKHQIFARELESETFYIVLDKAERLRDIEANFLPAFLRLQELAQLNVCVILLSQIVWEKYHLGTGFYEPITLYFPDYSKSELLQIMAKDCPSAFPPNFFTAYCQLLMSVFYSVCRDLKELRHLALLHFPKYCEPVQTGDAAYTDSRKLWRNIEPHLKKALHTVYLREVSSDQWEEIIGQNTCTDAGSPPGGQGISLRSHIELPFYAKYLLIASYLASYNPATTDRRFFTKQGRRGLSGRAKAAAKGKKSNTQLTGPKNFQLDRLMAIFYSIVEDKVAPSASILCQISSLVSLSLLAQVTSDDQIDCPKYKCLVNFLTISEIAKQLEFDIVQYLYDFV